MFIIHPSNMRFGTLTIVKAHIIY